jgi:hypothetical protein
VWAEAGVLPGPGVVWGSMRPGRAAEPLPGAAAGLAALLKTSAATGVPACTPAGRPPARAAAIISLSFHCIMA